MSGPGYRVIRGEFVVLGKKPDGDSVRFLAANPDNYQGLQRADRIDPSTVDGSVQLRFEGVDAPETHYGSAAQPLGDAARDALLAWMGFASLQYSATNPGEVVAATPTTIPAAILSKAVDPNGRPIAYALLDADAAGLDDGDWVWVDAPILARTLNRRLLAEGHAYYTVYTSTPRGHREYLRGVAADSRAAGLGLWPIDMTKEWTLETQASIAPGGQLILPKLFRRCTDYLKAVDRGFVGNLTDWLLANATGSRSEDDHVLICGTVEVPLSVLLTQRNRRIRFAPDVLDVVFVEK